MTLKEYQNKVRGCWLGKNAGGTLGAPFEGWRGVFDVSGYTQDMSGGALPNDDLDLQLVWLNAAERFGRNVDATILAEYWLSCVSANWSEYGVGKNNLAAGLLPPHSGWYFNRNGDSCGAFIRSELWACICPGQPQKAVRYAFEDAIVDHSNEGVYAEIFTAAIQAAAFAESDAFALIEVGLSYLPADCGVRRAVNSVIASFRGRLDWRDARKALLQAEPGSFGMIYGHKGKPDPEIPDGATGYDAPSNVGIMVIGWLYGGGDFGKSLCIAVNCGEDADCTAATLGAILGIISGGDALPEEWLKPLGDGIKTIAIDVTSAMLRVPQTVSDLTTRVCALMPEFMREDFDLPGGELRLRSGSDLLDRKERRGAFGEVDFKERLNTQPFGLRAENTIIEATLTALDGLNITEETPVRFRLDVLNRIARQQWLRLRWFAPEGWDARERSFCLDQLSGGAGVGSAELSIIPRGVSAADYEAVLEITSVGRPSRLYIPVKLFNAG